MILSSFRACGSMVEEMVRRIYEMINTTSDAAMRRRTACKGRYPYYWWNDEIRNLRSACLGAREGPSVREGDRHGNRTGGIRRSKTST